MTAYIEREYIFLDGITRGVKGRGCDDTGEREGARTYVRTMAVEEERRRLPAGEEIVWPRTIWTSIIARPTIDY